MDRAQLGGAVLVACGILGVLAGAELTLDGWANAAPRASVGEPQAFETHAAGLTSALLMVLGVMSGVVGGLLLRPIHRP